MKILQLYLNFFNFEKLPQTNICILAGDIGYPLIQLDNKEDRRKKKAISLSLDFLDFLKEFKKIYKTVIFVPGNHEYYQTRELKMPDDVITETDKIMKLACEQANVIFLNCNTYVDPETSIEFIGCTLWTLISSKTFDNMNDDKIFRNHIEYGTKHLEHIKWLTSISERPTQNKRVIITHHLPSAQMIHPKSSDMNDGFYCNCEDLIKQSKPLAWFCGHTHERMTKVIENVLVTCNPWGYPGENRETTFSYDPILLSLN